MLGAPMKKLIIVVDDKTKKYGELLSALISTKDDKEDQIVGTKDGSVESVIWTEKVYADNQAQLSSNNKVLFIGESESAQAVAANINCSNPFEQYGVKYGSLGNKAVIYVNNQVLSNNTSNYEDFFNNYVEFIAQNDFKYVNNQVIEKVGTARAQIQDKTETTTENIGKTLNKGIALLNKGVGFLGKKVLDKENLSLPQISDDFIDKSKTAVVKSMVFSEVAKAMDNKEITDQQYRCGVIAYYVYELANFMDK